MLLPAAACMPSWRCVGGCGSVHVWCELATGALCPLPLGFARSSPHSTKHLRCGISLTSSTSRRASRCTRPPAPSPRKARSWVRSIAERANIGPTRTAAADRRACAPLAEVRPCKASSRGDATPHHSVCETCLGLSAASALLRPRRWEINRALCDRRAPFGGRGFGQW